MPEAGKHHNQTLDFCKVWNISQGQQNLHFMPFYFYLSRSYPILIIHNIIIHGNTIALLLVPIRFY